MKKLGERFEEAIKDSKFTIREWQGFCTSPKLALITGIAMGYKMGMDDCKNAVNKYGEMKEVKVNEN